MDNNVKQADRSNQKSARMRVPSSGIPQAPEAESALVRAFIEPSNAHLLKVARRLVTPAAFYDPALRKIYSVICALADSQQAVDKVSITEALRARGELEGVGGPEAIRPDFDLVVDEARIRELAKSVHDMAVKRQLCAAARRMGLSARNGAASEDIIARAHVDLSQLSIKHVQVEEVDGAGLLDELVSYFRRYVVLCPVQLDALALFVLHTHAFEAADCTPYLSIKAPDKRCGKTRLLETLEPVVRRPWLTGRTTAAALVRKIAAEQPTLLLDESDAAFGSDKDYAEALRGVLNNGHRRGGASSVCVGKGSDLAVKDFEVFSPKVIAGIGRLPPTVEDRAIPIAMKRRKKGENIERFRRREAVQIADLLRVKAENWAFAHLAELEEARPSLPEQLGDRAADCYEPLFAIADAIGGKWPDRARKASIELSTGAEVEDSSWGVQLLTDIHSVFDTNGEARIASKTLLSQLAAMEGHPWAEFCKGKSLSPSVLARLLRNFAIRPRQLWLDNSNVQGYERADFEDSWARYTTYEHRTDPRDPRIPIAEGSPILLQPLDGAEPGIQENTEVVSETGVLGPLGIADTDFRRDFDAGA